jgi:signal peptidase II
MSTNATPATPLPPATLTKPSLLADCRPWLLLIAAVVILADRLTKLWIVAHLERGHFITVIPGVFKLSHVYNTGAAFSLFEQMNPHVMRNILVGFSVVAIAAVLILMWRVGSRFTVTGFALALILGGAIGNLYDRLRFSYVVDFLQVFIFGYHWPDFNVADSCIVPGACLLLVEIFRNQPAKN